MKHKAITLGNLCAKLELHCPQEHGNIKISGVATLEEAVAGDLCFLSNMRYTAQAEKTTASAIFVKADTGHAIPVPVPNEGCPARFCRPELEADIVALVAIDRVEQPMAFFIESKGMLERGHAVGCGDVQIIRPFLHHLFA